MSLASSAASLRAITYRITTTPTKQLPQIVPQVAASLWNCKDVLSAKQEATKATNDSASVVNRFKTSLSSLLQDRTIEGRWAAIVFVKAAIEAGGVEVLSKSGAWVRSLLAILKKKGDPPSTHNLAVITLTRVFMLTWDYSNLVREITTPTLPNFISSCLSNVEHRKCSATELQAVLDSFIILIPRHPTIFRTNETQIRSLVAKILSKTSSSDPTTYHTKDHKFAAGRLFVLLHHCAPKQGDSEKWLEVFEATISAAHVTCDHVFRSVIENSLSTFGRQSAISSIKVTGGELEFEGQDPIGLGHWKGVFPGGERLTTLIGILQAHVEVATANAVYLRVGLVVNLMSRIFTLISQKESGTLKLNEQIPKDERDAMLSTLPSIQVSILELLRGIVHRCGHLSTSIAQTATELVTNAFSTKADNAVRRETYGALEEMLNIGGPSLSEEEVSELAIIMARCCEDLLPPNENDRHLAVRSVNGATSKKNQPPNGDLTIQHAKTQPTHPTAHNDLHAAAVSLLPVFIATINPANTPRKLRVQIERTAILTRHKDALVACVLNPAKKDARTGPQTSLLPLLAREFPDSPEVEALLRPRIPPAVARSHDTRQRDKSDEEGDEEEDVDGERNLSASSAGRDEPMGGMSNIATQNDSNALAQEDEDDLYSATPRLENGIPGNHVPADKFTLDQDMPEQPSSKRTAAQLDEEDNPNKRQRADPIAESLLPESAGMLPGADPDTVQAAVPSAVQVNPPVTEPDTSHRVVTEPEQPAIAVSGAADVGSDDSDFEMPPLTMESDTDPEGEDGQEDEAEE